MKTDLNFECKELEIIIDNLMKGKDKCDIRNDRFSLTAVIDYLRGYLTELKNLNSQIMEEGNTEKLLKEVYDKYSELWMFQVEFYIDSLSSVVGGLWCYPNDK